MPITLENPNYNAMLKQIHQVLGNIAWTFKIKDNCVDEDDPWQGILAAAAFIIISTENMLNGNGQVQLVFGCDTILLRKHKVDCELICQQEQTQIDNIRNNNKRVDHDSKV